MYEISDINRYIPLTNLSLRQQSDWFDYLTANRFYSMETIKVKDNSYFWISVIRFVFIRISFPLQITLRDFDDIFYNAIYGVRSKSLTSSLSDIDSMYAVVILDLEIICCSKQLKRNEYHI